MKKDFSQNKSNRQRDRIMAMEAMVVLLIALIWFSSPPIIAQEFPTETSMERVKQEQGMEEITIIGQQELFSLKKETIRAEGLKFEIFNSLNSTDDFDITCEMIVPINSHIKHRVCDVKFMKKARTEEARRLLDTAFRVAGASGLPPEEVVVKNYLDFGLIRSDQQLAGLYTAKFKALNKEMIALAVEHPELATAMIREHELKQRYLAEHREKHKDSILIGHPKSEQNIEVMNELDMLHITFLDHKKGAMTEAIWERWDTWYRTLFHKESYRSMWASANRDNYGEEFIAYINAIISEE